MVFVSIQEMIASYFAFELFAKCANYFQFREIIFEILIYNTSRKRAVKKIRKAQSLKDKITMNYTLEYTKEYRKELLFWLRAKKSYVLFSCIVFSVSMVLLCISKVSAFEIFFKAQIIVELVILILLRIQFGFDGRTTKYEKERLNKHRKMCKNKNQGTVRVKPEEAER